MKNHTQEDHAEERFSVWFFAIVIISSLSLIGILLAFFARNTLVSELHSNWKSFVITFLSVHLAMSFVEFFFHRYVLHAPVVPFLAYFYKQHTHHHNLTRVALPRTSENVINKFPILEEEQHEASFFPAYSLLVFAGLATPFFVLVHYLLPHAPIFIAGYLALAWSLGLYELLHALEHKSVESWKPLLEHPRFGAVWKVVYGFHLRHHADIHSNESISGFFGFPVPDLVFGTWVNPDTLYEHQTVVEKKEFESPRPSMFIRWLDRYAEMAIQKRRSKASA
jgi:hemolysin III